MPNLPYASDLSRDVRPGRPQPLPVVTVYNDDKALRDQVIDLSHRLGDLEEDNSRIRQDHERILGENETIRGYFLLSAIACLTIISISIASAHQSRVYYPSTGVPTHVK